MIFTETNLKGAFLIEPERKEDHRGFFARTWCQQEFESQGLNPRLVQCSLSFNKKKGTLRGMHYQARPFEETKLVRCTKGEIFDVIVDLRPKSATFKSYFSVVLNDENRMMLYIPEGFAHGFQTLSDNTEIFYQMSQLYSPDHSTGVRWDDPAFGIQWPEDTRIILDRDNNYPDFGI
jgi:dTDP-4-dehydrorhamnose 3,5-epimerase